MKYVRCSLDHIHVRVGNRTDILRSLRSCRVLHYFAHAHNENELVLNLTNSIIPTGSKNIKRAVSFDSFRTCCVFKEVQSLLYCGKRRDSTGRRYSMTSATIRVAQMPILIIC